MLFEPTAGFGYLENMTEKKQAEERLGDLLLEKDLVKPEQLDKAVQCQVLFGGRLGTNLLELGFVTEDDLRSVLENKYNLCSVKRDELKDIPNEVIGAVPRDFAESHNLVPVKLTKEEICAAMQDPWKESDVTALRDLTGRKVVPLIALELDIYWALEKYYGTRRDARLINLDGWLERQRRPREKPPVKKGSKDYTSEPMLPPTVDITALEGAPKDLDDFWDRVGRSGHPEYMLPRVLKEMDQAETREEIAGLLLDYSATVFRRSMLFVVNEDMLFGWDARGEGLDSRLATAIMLPLSRKSVFKTVVETSAYFLGPIPESPINKRFLNALGETRPRTAILLPIIVAGKVAGILYGDMGHEKEVDMKLAPLQSALASAGGAFYRLIIRRKRESPR